MTKVEKESIAKRLKAIRNIRQAYIETAEISPTIQNHFDLKEVTDAKIIMDALDRYFEEEMEEMYCLFEHIDCKTPEAFGQDHVKIDNEDEIPFN